MAKVAAKRRNDRNERVVFRRVGGRIVPISVGTGGTIGAGAALDAARTTELASKDITKAGIRVTKKSFARQPAVFDTLGTKLNFFSKKSGTHIGEMSFFKESLKGSEAGRGTVSWLGVKKGFRGQGYSKIFSKIGAGEMRRQDITHTFNHVVHEGSLLTNYSPKRDVLYRALGTGKDGLESLKRVSRDAAVKNIKWHRSRWVKPSGKFDKIMAALVGQERWLGNKAPDIFRDSTLKHVPFRNITEFRPFKNKATIAVGAVAAASALAYFAMRKNDAKK